MDEPYRPTVHTQAELQAVWSHLMGPWGFGRRSIWMLRFDADHRLLPVVTEIVECDQVPDTELATGLGDALRLLDDDGLGGTFAFLISRPGRGIDDADRAWGRFLLEVARTAGVRMEMLHLATDAGTRPLPPDDLTQRRTA